MYETINRVPYTVEGRSGILFVGGFTHTPNVDAMIWFSQEIFPIILKNIPDIHLHVAGSNAPDKVRALAGEHITVHGFVSTEQLQQLYAECRMSVVPLRYGAGIKGKIVEAMGIGCPIASTSVGVEGLDGAETFIAVENDAEAFANRVAIVYNDECILQNMVEKAYDYIEEHFSEQAAWNDYCSALEL
jgi:glycosyltransferase involved in cell wall biosynthesis